MKKPLLLVAALSAISISASAWWGQTGHRVVGEIADRYLTSKTRKAIRAILGNEQPLSEWFYESYRLAGTVYRSVTQTNQRLSFRYNFDHVELVNEQLLRAGVRLAGLLNRIFA